MKNKTVVNEENAIEIILFLLLMFIALTLCNCSNWQGAEFRIGIGSYNGANETRTYQAEKESQKDTSKRY